MQQSGLKKLAIITTHPIQYYAPLFKLLHQRENIAIKVFYTAGKTGHTRHDPGFDKPVSWDIPLMDGYPFEWVKNTSRQPGSHHFKGIVNPEIINQLRAWSPDALLVYGWAYSGHLKALRYFKNKIPVYFRGDSTLLNESAGLKGLLKSICLKWVYQHVDQAFYVGTNNYRYFKRYGLQDGQLTFAPHAIDNTRFNIRRDTEVQELRDNLQLTNNDMLVLYAGKFEPVKNLSLLVNAFTRLGKGNVHMLLAGNGVDEDSLRLLAAQSPLKAHIHFTGFKNQSYMPVLYQATDLVCLPSGSETWGLCINEAMACNKAILASDKVGCAVDLVQTDYNGNVFKSGETDSLLRCLKQLTVSRKKLAAFGKNSGLVIKSWNFTSIAEAIENKLTHERERPH